MKVKIVQKNLLKEEEKEEFVSENMNENNVKINFENKENESDNISKMSGYPKLEYMDETSTEMRYKINFSKLF